MVAVGVAVVVVVVVGESYVMFLEKCTQQMPNIDECSLWVGNVGLPGFSGESIVDMILNGEKKWKYISGMVNCFDDQWIALREIRNQNPFFTGRCRCAIQLDAKAISHAERPEIFKEEWGWSALHAAKENAIDDEKGATWYAHRILNVKLLAPPVYLCQTNQGKFWRLKTHHYLTEAACLLLAVNGAILNPNSQVIMDNRDVPLTRARRRLRRRGQRIHAREITSGRFFFRNSTHGVRYDCCGRNCMEEYGCSKAQYDERRSQAKFISAVRATFQNMDRVTQRQCLEPRLISRNMSLGIRTRRVFLEPLVTIRDQLRVQGTFSIIPKPETLQRVCGRFFKWVFAISNNKLDQPTMTEDEDFSVKMHGPRVRSWYDLGASEFYHQMDAGLCRGSSPRSFL